MCFGKKQKQFKLIKTFLKNNSIPLGIYLLFLIVMCYTFVKTNRGELHLQINNFVGNPFIDNFFFFLTFLVDGYMGVVVLAIAFLMNIRLGIYLTLSFVFAALLTNLLKYQFFQDHDRPYWFYQYVERHELKKVVGVDLLIKKSFPSGHATQAFAIFFASALVSVKKQFKLLFTLIALLGAFSRVYLAQHWLEDITAGSFVGSFFAILFYFTFYTKPFWPKLNKPLLHLFK